MSAVENKELVSLKRKLKFWERNFLQKHGRKPTKTDVESTAPEFQTLYRQYRNMKNGAKKELDSLKDGINVAGVFGESLNKSRNHQKQDTAEPVQRKKTWNLPQAPFIKPKATTTRNPVCHDPKVVLNPASISPKVVLNPALTSPKVVLDPALSSPKVVLDPALSSPKVVLNPALTSQSQPLLDDCESPPVMIAGQCRKPSGPLRHSSVSADWLERCRPDLSDVGEMKAVDDGQVVVKQKAELESGKEGKTGLLWRSLSREKFKGEQNETLEDGKDSVGVFNDEGPLGLGALNPSHPPFMSVVGVATRDPDTLKPHSPHSSHPYNSPLRLLTNSLTHKEHSPSLSPHPDNALMDEKHSSSPFPIMDKEHSPSLSPHPNPLDSSIMDEESSVKHTSAVVKEIRKPGKTPGEKPSTSRAQGRAVSENFVRLNMKVKRHSRRPGRTLSGSAFKKREWKKQQREETRGAIKKGVRFTCFKCGKPGHWAKNCSDKGGSTNLGVFSGQKVEFNESVALGLEEELSESALEVLAKESQFPSVGEAARLATGAQKGDEEDLNNYVPPPPCRTPSPPPVSMEPLYKTENGKIISTPNSVFAALKKLGHSTFRPGQEEAVMRILSGVSTLVITTTGSGKSLCYQLPAYLYKQTRPPCVTLVISPLVSLMDDQVLRFPPALKGACLHNNQTRLQREKVLREVSEGRVDVLLLSPEALVGGALWNKREGPYSLPNLPPIAFACIDEAHCISEWSHNFRPSYLRLYKTLREHLGVQVVLGLTATATHATGLSVARHLGVAQENILRGPSLPNNLSISVSSDKNRDKALVELLEREPFRYLDSIIIYCTRQQTTESVAQFLRTSLQSWNQNGTVEEIHSEEMEPISRSSRKRKKTLSGGTRAKRQTVLMAECYHAGLTASQRKSVQNKFMKGTLRIVVATVAFGMGLNKPDVRAIIHYNIPKSFESFIQEIGRAGRDGKPAFCHVFLDKEGSDLYELRRHAYSNSAPPYSIKKLVEKSFPTCHCREARNRDQASSGHPSSKSPRICAGHEVAFPIESTVLELDLKEECVATLLCYLELQGWLEVRNPVRDTCTLKCYGGHRQLRALARKVPSVAAATARLREKGVDLESASHITFSIIETANSMGWDSRIFRSELIGLQVNDRGTCSTSSGVHSTILVEIDESAFHLIAPGDLTPEERENIIQSLSDKVSEQETREVMKLHQLHAALRAVATETHDSSERSSNICLIDIITQYFSSDGLSATDLTEQGIPVISTTTDLSHEEEELILHNVATLVSRFRDHRFTGRAIACIFHGIPSPKFPALVWGSQKGFWRCHLDVDFPKLCQLATTKLLEIRK